MSMWHLMMALAVAFGIIGAAPGQAEFVRLGGLPGAGAVRSAAYAVSADGTTVTGSAQGSLSYTRAYRWTAATGMQDLGLPLPGPNDLFQGGLACSPTGRVIVGEAEFGEPGTARGFYAVVGEAAVLLPLDITLARGVSDDAMSMIVGGVQSFPCSFAVVWRPGQGWTQISPCGFASAVTPDSRVVVGSGGPTTQYRAFRWTQQGGLVLLSTSTSQAFGVTPDGSFIVGYVLTGAGYEAASWTAAGEVTVLGDLPGGTVFSTALGVSADGQRIVGRGRPGPSIDEAFVYEAGLGLRNLRHVLVKQHGLGEELLGWRLESANGISADGTVIVGTGFHPSNPNGEAFLIRLPRCPGDYNRDGAFSPADVVSFVAAWFDSLAAGNDWGDFDLDGQVTPADVAAFVKAWYAAATGACP